ncbi:MAG: D-alanyl-D-alanine carboxypeptidase [Oscillospiraceae bacterium]|nr:D-alanyl-D-alanine carboxypeptidase [Oscillospiraceae bacterium]
MKRLLPLLLTAALLAPTAAAAPACPTVSAASALLMEQETGTVLYEQNAHEKLEPASVTKVMTLLLIMEALDSGRITKQDVVTVSPYAAGMGGSQVYLEAGEQMSVHEMLKCIAVSSANDAAVAMAEYLCGSEDAFVSQMNERAAQLGMADTRFSNCTGLPISDHYTSAYDIALMSRQLLFHPDILSYTTIWMDTIRGGAFGLSNTNRLIRHYPGAVGLKTGFTDSALYCLSAAAQRDGMTLIATVMGAPSSDTRFQGARTLLDYGFANYALTTVHPQQALPTVPVLLGENELVQPVPEYDCRLLLPKGHSGQLTTEFSIADNVEAPVEQGQRLGEMTVCLDGQPQAVIPLVAAHPVARLTFPALFSRLVRALLMAD